MAILKQLGRNASDFVVALDGIRGVRNYGPYGVMEVNNMSAQLNRTKASLPLSTSRVAGQIDFPDRYHPCEQGMLLVYDEAAGVVRKARNINENLMIHYSETKLYDERRQMLSDFALFGQYEDQRNVLGQVQGSNGSGMPAPPMGGNRIPAAAMGQWLQGGTTWYNEAGAAQTLTGTPTTLFYDETPFPRMLQPMAGDIFTTNLVVFDPAAFADIAAMEAAIAEGNVWATVAVGVDGTVGGGTGNWPAAPSEEATNGYYHLTQGAMPTAAVVFKAVSMPGLPDGQPGIRFEVWRTV